jgi:arsenate reductase (thioredoxin)
MTDGPKRVLFMCTGNSCRSQMAEGLLRSLGEGKVDAFSAGTDPKPVHPLAKRVMDEIGIDLSTHRSKSLDEYRSQDFDYVISVCARAAEQCPVWPRSREQIRWSFDDPAEATGTEENRLAVFRRVRNELRQRIGLFLVANRLVQTDAQDHRGR